MTSRPVIVGAGLAGLATALRLAPEPCIVLCADTLLSGTASGWAQGGVAAAIGPEDSCPLHTEDTLTAGAGLCDPDVVSTITAAGPETISWLTGLGVRFDRSPEGGYRLGLEGAHGRHRIVHSGGDRSGAEIMRAVAAAVRSAPSITVLEGTRVHRLELDHEGAISGVLAWSGQQQVRIAADRVVLATGGAGALWAQTTNPRAAVGTGLALAARAGAVLRDLEMVQFHPTALDVGEDPMPLVSEAVRGQGAVLVDGDGRRLLPEGTGGDLASRDIVARAVWGELHHGGQVGLDTRAAPGDRFAEHFPTIQLACLRAGIDPAHQPVPVRPAAHYHCGGVLVDRVGRSSVPGLWAVGEVASTGLHGANRLASNSLLEAAVCGALTAQDLRQQGAPPAAPRLVGTTASSDLPGEVSCHSAGTAPALSVEAYAPAWLRELMSEHLGITRDGRGLAVAVDVLQGELDRHGPEQVPDTTLVALLIARSAHRREESRGGHLRTDHPGTAPLAEHTLVSLADVTGRRTTGMGDQSTTGSRRSA